MPQVESASGILPTYVHVALLRFKPETPVQQVLVLVHVKPGGQVQLPAEVQPLPESFTPAGTLLQVPGPLVHIVPVEPSIQPLLQLQLSSAPQVDFSINPEFPLQESSAHSIPRMQPALKLQAFWALQVSSDTPPMVPEL